MSVERTDTSFDDLPGDSAGYDRADHVDAIAAALPPKQFETFIELPADAHEKLFLAAYMATLEDPKKIEMRILEAYTNWFCYNYSLEAAARESDVPVARIDKVVHDMPRMLDHAINAKQRALGMASVHTLMTNYLDNKVRAEGEQQPNLADVIEVDFVNHSLADSEQPHETEQEGVSYMPRRLQLFINTITSDDEAYKRLVLTEEDKEAVLTAILKLKGAPTREEKLPYPREVLDSLLDGDSVEETAVLTGSDVPTIRVRVRMIKRRIIANAQKAAVDPIDFIQSHVNGEDLELLLPCKAKPERPVVDEAELARQRSQKFIVGMVGQEAYDGLVLTDEHIPELGKLIADINGFDPDNKRDTSRIESVGLFLSGVNTTGLQATLGLTKSAVYTRRNYLTRQTSSAIEQRGIDVVAVLAARIRHANGEISDEELAAVDVKNLSLNEPKSQSAKKEKVVLSEAEIAKENAKRFIVNIIGEEGYNDAGINDGNEEIVAKALIDAIGLSPTGKRDMLAAEYMHGFVAGESTKSLHEYFHVGKVSIQARRRELVFRTKRSIEDRGIDMTKVIKARIAHAAGEISDEELAAVDVKNSSEAIVVAPKKERARRVTNAVAKNEVKKVPLYSELEAGNDAAVELSKLRGQLVRDLNQQQPESERKDLDTFVSALRPPVGWAEDGIFKEDFDGVVVRTIDQATRKGLVSDTSAYVIKMRLGLAPEVSEQVQMLLGTQPLNELAVLASRQNGRLIYADKDPRVKAMSTTLSLFSRGKLDIKQVGKKFGEQSDLAELFLKAAVAEVLMANIRRL